MTNDGRYLDLDEHLEEIEEQQNMGKKILVEYYLEGENKRDPPPHLELFERSARLVAFAIEIRGLVNRTVLGKGRPITHTYYTLIGIATEILLKGIYLKNDPINFIEHIENSDSNQTPNFNVAKNELANYLPDDFGDEQYKRIFLVLKVIQTHRNNLVHFGMGRLTISAQPKAIFEVLQFFFAYFPEEDITIEYAFEDYEVVITELLDERIQELDKRIAGMDYPPVDFGVSNSED